VNVLILSHLFPTTSSPARGVFVRLQAEAVAKQARCWVVSGQYPGVRLEPPQGVTLDVEYLRLPWGPAPAPSSARLFRAARHYRAGLEHLIARKGRPDVIHAHYAYPDGEIAIECGRAFGVPVVVTLHGSDVNVQLVRPVVGRWLAKRLELASRLVIVSERMREALAERSAALAAGAVTIPNGFDAESRSVLPSEHRHGLVFCGQLVPLKNVHVLLRAYALVRDKVESPLKIVGGGVEETRLRELSVALGLGSRVRFLGELPHDEAVRQIAGARSLVLPSQREGLPTVLIEALSSGTPVVASHVGGAPDLIAGRDVGVLVPPGDVEALAEALVSVESRGWDHEAIARTPGVLSWDEVAGQLVKVYEEAAGGG